MWRTFRTESDGIQRFFYTDENTSIKLENKTYFNKNTNGAIIYRGFETLRNSEVSISEEIYYIAIDYYISNYFGDKSGMHFRSKKYVLIEDKIFQQCNFGEVKEVVRHTKELKGILSELN